MRPTLRAVLSWSPGPPSGRSPAQAPRPLLGLPHQPRLQPRPGSPRVRPPLSRPAASFSASLACSRGRGSVGLRVLPRRPAVGAVAPRCREAHVRGPAAWGMTASLHLSPQGQGEAWTPEPPAGSGPQLSPAGPHAHCPSPLVSRPGADKNSCLGEGVGTGQLCRAGVLSQAAQGTPGPGYKFSAFGEWRW